MSDSLSSQDYKEFEERIGLRIATLRKERGLTQQEFAVLADIPYESYRVIERGKSITVRKMYAVATALGVPITYLLEEGVEQTGEDMALRATTDEIIQHYPELVTTSRDVLRILIDTLVMRETPEHSE